MSTRLGYGVPYSNTRLIKLDSSKMVQTSLINHIAFIIDESTSMDGQPTVRVFDRQLKALKQRSIDMGQETRISIYLFSDNVKCLAFDMDIMRFDSLEGYYVPWGNTALLDATLLAVQDHKRVTTLYGDHAFLLCVLTDGENNINNNKIAEIKHALANLGENWTVACLVPGAVQRKYMKEFGFPEGAIEIWDTNSKLGLETAVQAFDTGITSFMTMRSTGVRGAKSGLFTLDTDGLTKTTVKARLQELNAATYEIFPVRYHVKRGEEDKGTPIKEFVESWTKLPYVMGSAYYQPTKTVKIQDHKNILIQEIKTGKVYEGREVRGLLGLPQHTLEVNPGQHSDWRIFVQSTSFNRKLYKETFLLLRK